MEVRFFSCHTILLLVTFEKIIYRVDMFFAFNGGKIYYNDIGEGSPVVLLHGYLESSDIWYDFAKKLSGKYRVISVDLPGHGMSGSYGSTHTMEFMANIVKELLDMLGIKKVFLTGHSLGGYVTLAFLELFPEILSGYSLFHSQPFPDTPEAIEKRMREITLTKEGKQEIFYPDNIKRMFAGSNLEKFNCAVKHSMDIASGLNGDGMIAVLNGMMTRPSRLSLMEEGRVPCLWVLGAMDNYISCENIQTRVKLPSNAKLVILQNSGHMGFIEEEELSVKILSDFITSIM
jgi:pimeloyl-ACP methyl ester carboxylesterase